MRVSEHLYLYTWTDPRENNCNSVFISGKTPTLIDPGLEKHLDHLFDSMRDDHLDPSKIAVVLCTHAHPDHIGGILKLQRSARIGISREEHRFVETTGRAIYEKHGRVMPDYRIDFYLKGGGLTLGKYDLDVIMTPGHSPGGISVFWPRYKALISGDNIFQGSMGRTDVSGGDPVALRRSLDTLSELNAELLLPGHGTALNDPDAIRRNFTFVKSLIHGAL